MNDRPKSLGQILERVQGLLDAYMAGAITGDEFAEGTIVPMQTYNDFSVTVTSSFYKILAPTEEEADAAIREERGYTDDEDEEYIPF